MPTLSIAIMRQIQCTDMLLLVRDSLPNQLASTNRSQEEYVAQLISSTRGRVSNNYFITWKNTSNVYFQKVAIIEVYDIVVNDLDCYSNIHRVIDDHLLTLK